MPSNAQSAYDAARKQVEALYRLYEARQVAARKALSDVVSQLEREGKLTQVSALDPLGVSRLLLVGPRYTSDVQEHLRKVLSSFQHRASEHSVAGGDSDFSKPLNDFAHQLGAAEGAADVDNEAHSLVKEVRTAVGRIFKGSGSGSRRFKGTAHTPVTEEQQRAFGEAVRTRASELGEGIREPGEAHRFSDPMIDATYTSAYDAAVVERQNQWRPPLARLNDAVLRIVDGEPAEAGAVALEIKTVTDGIVAEMGRFTAGLLVKTSVEHLATLREEWEEKSAQLAAWEELGRAVPDVWATYLASENGKSLLTAFEVELGDVAPDAFLKQISAAALGSEVKAVSRIAERGAAGGMSL